MFLGSRSLAASLQHQLLWGLPRALEAAASLAACSIKKPPFGGFFI
jgi:hypothetical protein